MPHDFTEEWRPVPIAAVAHLYEISNYGRVRSLDRSAAGKAGSTRLVRGRLLKGTIDKKGYRRTWLCTGTFTKNALTHRIVAGAFIPNPEQLPEVNHIDGIKTNCVWTNLEWMTRVDNHTHAVENGLRSNFKRVLSTEDIAEIRQMIAAGHAGSDIANGFGVHQSTISRIATGLRRVHH